MPLLSDVQYQTNNGIPPGAVMSFAMSAAPVGWLNCDGSAVSRSTYQGLFNAIGIIHGAGNGTTTFNLPNLQGQFIRGWTANKSTTSRDPLSASRAFGNVQSDAFLDHQHNFNDYYQYGVGVGAGGIYAGGATRAEAGGNTPNTTTTTTVGAGGTETRPVNIALLYCIKT